MSLFGTSPDEPSRKTSQSLFDDEPSSTPKHQGSGLFADGGNDDTSSPWDLVTPKKQARSNLVKTLLPATEVPESYVDTFDTLLESGKQSGAGVSTEGVQQLLQGTGLNKDEQAKVLDIVAPGGVSNTQGLGRGEFNVLLALIGLSQEKEEVSLDGVDERKARLPIPKVPQLRSQTTKSTPQRVPTSSSHTPDDTMSKQSVGDTDPWGSPSRTKRNGVSSAQEAPDTPGYQASGPQRTTSNFSRAAADADLGRASQQGPGLTASGMSEEWEGYSRTSTFGADDLARSGFGGSGLADSDAQFSSQPKSTPRPRQVSQGAEENLTVLSLPEKEGMLFFQYRNYEISSSRRATKVIRRYSDFVWLLDCLHKRYPFRQLPLLPPKRISINGNHLATDALFIEKRRRGLARFANALIRHPVLREEQLVTMFLTVPTELSAWRKQAAITVQEEFTGKSLPPTLEDSLSPTLEDLFATVRSGVRRSAEMYITLCSTLERLVKRRDGLAGEYSRFMLTLQDLSEASAESYHIDTNDVPMLNEGINATAKHLARHQGLIEDESRAWDEGALEDFKRQRDCLVSVRDMFDRRDRYAKDTIPQLERRIQANESKLGGVRSKPEGTRKVGEAEKLEDTILRDKESIVAQHARGVFIKECIRDEIQIFQTSQYHISRTHQDWSQDRVRFAEMQAENWKALSEEVESMPTGPTNT